MIQPDTFLSSLIEQASELAVRNQRTAIEATAAYLQCPHRGDQVATLDGRTAGCGCGSEKVPVHECNHFAEPVLIRSQERCREAIQQHVPAFTGRTCRACDVPRKADVTIFHLTHRPNWQDQRRRSAFALKQHGITVHAVELVKPSERRLREAWAQHQPTLVFNHAFVGVSKTMIQMAKEYPKTPIVTVDHSNQNHTFTWPQYFQEMRLILEAGEELDNVWMASPDAYMPWTDLGYRQYLHWPNPVHLPPVPNLPAARTDPPTVCIVGRTDWMKGFPAQIAAMALVQRQRPLRVVMMFNGDERRKAGLYEHADACRLRFETPDWMTPETWESFLRDQVSVVCQSSFSESFNYVSIDAAAFGRPFVGSESIRHTPQPWRVSNPNDCYEIASKLETILDDYPAASRLARKVADSVADRNNRQYAALVKKLSKKGL